MPYPLDPASLAGDELEQWYRRSPQDIENERQAAEAQRYRDFFGQQDTNTSMVAAPQRIDTPDIDPGSFIKFPTLPPDFGQQIEPSVDSAVDSSGAPPSATFGHVWGAGSSGNSNPPASGIGALGPTSSGSKGVAYPDHIGTSAPRVPTPTLQGPTTPPLPTFFSSLFGGPVPITGPGGQVVGYYDHQAAKAGLGITAQYAAVAPLFHPAGWMDSLLADGGVVAANALRQVAESPVVAGPLNFAERELWQGGEAAGHLGQRLDDAAKTALRRIARERYAQANAISASSMNAQVHHSTPLEYAHLMSRADPNRLANLWGVIDQAHRIAGNEWTAFRTGLNGRIPTQAEIMAAKLKIDRMIAPYLQRAGISRPGPPVK